jgi:carboxymethylenebutenolidase
MRLPVLSLQWSKILDSRTDRVPEVSYQAPAGPMRGYLSIPAGAGPWPAVVVVMDVYGVSRDLRQQCDRLAGHGYLALAPDLYSWGSVITCIRATFAALRSGTGRAFEDIDAARGWLANRTDCTDQVGVIGFCMGGGFALLAAPRYDFAVASVNYGQVPKDADAVLAGSCPMVASFGGRDITLRGHSRRLEGALLRLEVVHDVKEYPSARHGFMNHHGGPLGPMMRVLGVGYDAEAAEDSWRRILDFFGQHMRRAATDS